jgi:hypothetical protein
MLSSSNATSSIMVEPNNTTGIYKNPIDATDVVMFALIEVAPPGGCMVLVRCMARIAHDTETGADSLTDCESVRASERSLSGLAMHYDDTMSDQCWHAVRCTQRACDTQHRQPPRLCDHR